MAAQASYVMICSKPDFRPTSAAGTQIQAAGLDVAWETLSLCEVHSAGAGLLGLRPAPACSILVRMTPDCRKVSERNLQPLWRALADATMRLGQAIGVLAEQPADPTGLLWVFALLADRSTDAGIGFRTEGHLRDTLTAIDRACAGAPEVRDAVDALQRLLVPRNIELLVQAAAPPACGGHAWVYLLEHLWAAADAQVRRRHGGYFTPQPIVRFIVRSVDATAAPRTGRRGWPGQRRRVG